MDTVYILSGESPESASLIIPGKSFTVSGKSNPIKQVSTITGNNNVLVQVKTAGSFLTMSSITFQLSTHCQIVKASVGSVSISSITIKPKSSTLSTTTSMIEITEGGSVDITSLEANSFTLNGNGAILSVTKPNSLSISTGCDFYAITASGKGQAIFIDLTDSSITPTIVSIAFSSCGTAASSDHGLYIQTRDMGTFVDSSSNEVKSWITTMLPSSYNNNAMYYAGLTGTGTTINKEVDLLHLTFPPTSQSSLSVTSPTQYITKDFPNCGWRDVPCVTIHAVHTNAESISAIDLVSGTHNTELSSTSFESVTMGSGESERTINSFTIKPGC